MLLRRHEENERITIDVTTMGGNNNDIIHIIHRPEIATGCNDYRDRKRQT